MPDRLLKRCARSRPVQLIVALVAIVFGLVGGALASTSSPGEIGPASQLTANGRLLHPAGRLTTVGDFPTGSAVAPSGHFLWVADCGHGQDDIKVVDVVSGSVVQTLPLPGCYGGVAFSPDGHHAYVSGTPKGSSPTEGPTQGDAGDVIHIFTVDPTTGLSVEGTPLALPATTGGSARVNSLPPVSGVGTAQPEGIAVSPDGRFLVVALNGADSAVVVDLSSLAETVVPIGAYPEGVAFDPQGRAYVSNEYDGTLSVIDPATAKVTSTISGLGGTLGDLNSHPEGMVADPKRALLYVAVTNRDLIAVVDTTTHSVTRLVSVARSAGLGTAPTSLAISPDDSTLYASDSGEDALAAISLSSRTGAGSSGSSSPQSGVGTGHTVHVPPSVRSIASYRSRRARAARRLARVHGAARPAARRQFARTVASLAHRYLRARSVIACAGPSRRQEQVYVNRVLHALGVAKRRRSALLARARRGLPATQRCLTSGHTVHVPPSVRSIASYRSRRARAARRLARVHGAARPAARRQFARTVASLAHRYLRARSVIACAGPSRRQEQVYVNRVLHALGVAKRRRSALLARARRALPAEQRCVGTGGAGGGGTGSGPTSPLAAFQVIGRIPTAAYPDSVQTTPQGQLLWVAGKGFGSGPNPTYYFGGATTPYQTPPTAYGTYVLDLLIGRVGALTIPTDSQIVADTPAADAQSQPSDSASQPAGSPIPAATGHPSTRIKHVFYIVRENRTYDQVFGADPRGDGNPNLQLFGDNGVSGPTGGITPNAHALTRQFPLLDHFYEDSEVSVDGHLITAGSYATDYVQKATAANYSNRRGTFDFGIYPVASPPNFYLFDQAAKQGVSFRDYGEAVGTIPLTAAPNRPQYPTVQRNVDTAYPNNLFIGCLQANNRASCTQDSGTYNATGTPFAGQSRFNEWYPQFQAQVATGTVPQFNYMILPNDHTNGTTTGDPTPQAFIADNDLALGQIVDAISHSSIWPSTAIFVVEDDSQDGADHVDSHRSPGLVISPWAKPGAVVHTRYDQYSVLRTMELILGLQPLALTDAVAAPMYDAFVSGSQQPNNAPYTVQSPSYPLTSTNSASAPLAKLSGELPFPRLDAVPQAISDQILWASVHGAKSSPPAAGPDASPQEVDRAAVVRAMLRRNPSVFGLTAGRRAHSVGRAGCPITWACRPSPPGEG